MSLRLASGMISLLLLASILTSAYNIRPVKAQTSGYAYTTKPQYATGEIVVMGFRNNGSATITLSSTAPWAIYDALGKSVYYPIALYVLVDVFPGESIAWQWDQRNNYGQQVAAGIYIFRIQTSAGSFIATFSITATFNIIAGRTRLTTDPSTQDMPSLLAVDTLTFRGYFLAYQSWETGGTSNGDIFVEKFDSNWNRLNKIQMTNLSSYQDSPSLTLVFDGANYYLKLAYVSTETGNYDIFVQTFDLNLNLIAKKQVTSSTSLQDLPSIIFDTSQSIYIAYQSWEAGSYYQGDIYIEKLNLNLDSLSKVRVTTETSYQDCPSLLYNPETGIIYVAYVSNETGNLDIFMKQYNSNLNYLGKFQLTTDSTTQYRPSLAPTYVSTYPRIVGFQMAYHSWETGTSNQRDIFVQDFGLSCNSLGKTQITNDQFYSATPSIVPSLVALGSSWCPGYVAYVSNETGNWDIWLQQMTAPPPPTYSATVNANCNTEGVDVGVAIMKDGLPSGFSTPHTFTGLTGLHIFTVPGTDWAGHAFKQWSTGSTSLTITVSSGGTYTAYYGEGPVVYISPYSSTVVVGRNVSIAVKVANVTDMYSWQIKLYFNSSSINCTGASYPDDQIFADRTFVPVTPSVGQNYIAFGASLVGDQRFSGSGTLCLLNFTGLREGACPLQFDALDTFLLNPDLNRMPSTATPGLITAVSTPTLVGDITGPDGVPDGIVDMYDISLVARYFDQTVPPAPSRCDITGLTPGLPDGRIDMMDISTVARHFGEHYP